MGTHKLERLTSNKRKQSVRQRVFIDSSVTNEAAFNGGADEATRNATTINNREARRMRQRKNANFHSGPASNTKGGSPTQTGAAGFADSQPVAGHQLYKGAVATAAPHTRKQWARAFATVGMAALMAAGSVFGALATSGEPALAASSDNGVLTETLPITSGANAANSSSVDTSSQTSQDYTLRTANDSTTVITTATVPLTQTAERATVGSIMYQDMLFTLQDDGETVALTGVNPSNPPIGQVAVPEVVSNGSELYTVTSIASGAFTGSYVTELTIPASIEDIALYRLLDEDERVANQAAQDAAVNGEGGGGPGATEGDEAAASDEAAGVPNTITLTSATEEEQEYEVGAFYGCDTLTSITVSENNPNYASFAGSLYTKDLTELLVVPEGMEGTLTIADPTTVVNGSSLLNTRKITYICWRR